MHVIRFTVVDHDPVGILLSYSIGGSRVERRGLGLWDFLYFAVQLRGTGLVESSELH